MDALKITKEEIRQRQAAARDILKKEGRDALIAEGGCGISQRAWLRYFLDYYVPVFTEYLVLPLEGPVVFFARSEENSRQVLERGAADEVVLLPPWESHKGPGQFVAQALKSCGISRPALCGEVSAMFLASLMLGLGELPFVDLTPKLEAIRMIKSEAELALCREAVALNEAVFLELLKSVRPGSREMEAVARASAFARRLNCEDQLWLIGSGRAPRPRSLAAATQLCHTWRKGELCSAVIEIAGSGGYFGEIAHLVSIGKPQEEVRRAFRALSQARREGEKLIRPGSPAGAAPLRISQALMEEGYWQAPYPGVMGHGQGLDMSEGPMLAAENEMPLQPGMRVNLHPALTLKSGAQVTACDCYEVTETGCANLSALPDEIIVL